MTIKRDITWRVGVIYLALVVLAVFVFGRKSSLVPLKKRANMDSIGAVLMTIGFFGLLFGLSQCRDQNSNENRDYCDNNK